MTTELILAVEESGADKRRVEELAISLRDELLSLDVEDVTQVPAGMAPPGARGVDVAALGALTVAMQASVDLARTVVDTIRSWLRGAPDTSRSVRLAYGDQVLEVTGVSSEQQDRLIEEFLSAIGSE